MQAICSNTDKLTQNVKKFTVYTFLVYELAGLVRVFKFSVDVVELQSFKLICKNILK